MLFSNKTKISKTATYTLALVLGVAVFMFFAPTLLAQTDLGLEPIAGTNLGQTDIKLIIVNIIRILLGFLALLALIIVLYGGFKWMTSGGNEENISKAKKILINGAIGLVIILASYSIVTFIFNMMEEAMSGGNNGGSTYQPYNISDSALGGGILESVYPEPSASGVPRNTLIMVTFKEDIQLDSIVSTTSHPDCPVDIDCGILAGEETNPNVRIVNLSENNEMLQADEVMVYTADNRTFIFNPYGNDLNNHLGNPNGYTDYAVNLSENILRDSNGFPAFITGGFTWQFEVSNIIDLTPPEVISYLPQGTVFRNTAIQIIFSEAINAAAAIDPESVVISYNGSTIEGIRTISNGFTTLTIVSGLSCGSSNTYNSCGDIVYCFPASTDFTVTVNKVDDPAQPLEGISDAAGNSMTNDFSWNFSTNNMLDLDPPHLTSIDPLDEEELVPRNKKVKAQFNEPLLASTVNSTNIGLFKSACVYTDDNDPTNDLPDFPTEITCYPTYTINLKANSTEVEINTYGLEGLTEYNPRFTSDIKDIYQNCFYPAVLTNP